MRSVASVARALRPGRRGWMFLAAVSLFLTFGLGGGPNGTPWLIVKFFVLGVLGASLLIELSRHAWRDAMRRRRRA